MVTRVVREQRFSVWDHRVKIPAEIFILKIIVGTYMWFTLIPSGSAFTVLDLAFVSQTVISGSVVVLEISLGFVLESTAFLLGLVSILNKEDSGF